MKIIFICHSIYPVVSPRSFRSTNLIRFFLEQGHEIDLIYFHGEAKELRKYGKLVAHKLNESSINTSNKYLSFILDYFFYYPFGLNIFKLFKQIRVLVKSHHNQVKILSVAAPHTMHWSVGLYFTRYNNIEYTWVADCGDPFIGLNSRFKPPFYFRWLENMFLRKATHVVVPIIEAINSYNAKHRHKFSVIPQLFYVEEDRSMISNVVLHQNNITVCSFAGTIKTIGRDIEPYLRVLSECDKELILRIYTSQLSLARSLAAKYNLNSFGKLRIEIFPLIPRYDLLRKLKESDFLLDIPNEFHNQRPSKLIDYAIVQRPFISDKVGSNFKQDLLAYVDKDYSNFKNKLDLDFYNIGLRGNELINLF